MANDFSPIANGILIQGEALTLGSQTGGSISLVRTVTQNWERDGAPLNPEPNSTPSNPNNQEFDAFGLRPDYTGDGYFDINGTAGEKAVATITALPTEATMVDVYLRVANGSAGTAAGNLRGITVAIDGVSETIASTQTSQFYLWGVQKITLNLPENTGDRVLTITTAASNGPNIDAIAIVEGGTPFSFLPPEITSPATLSLDENTLFVGTVVAQDLDQPVTSAFAGASALSDETLTYSIVETGDFALFTIDPATGDLSFVAAPDFEVDPTSYTLTVEVTDGALVDTQEITVNVLDVLELVQPVIAPIVLQTEDFAVITDALDAGAADGGANMLHRVRDDASTGESPGAGKDAFNLWNGYEGRGYTDFGANAGDLFTIDVSVTEAGVYDLHTRYANGSGAVPNRILDISVGAGPAQQVNFDRVGNALFSDWNVKTITVELAAGVNTLTYAISDIQDPKQGPNIDAIALTSVGAPVPAFTAPNYDPAITSALSVDVVEGDTAAGIVTAFDNDEDPISFALTAGGADNALFDIEASTGALTFLVAPDFETPGSDAGTNTYQVEVEVTDGQGGSSTQGLTVTVTDIDDTPTSVILSPVAVAENVAGATLADIVVTDPDTDLSGLTTGDVTLSDTVNFRVIDDAGVLKLALAETVALDFEAASQPPVTVTVNGTSSLFTPAPTNDPTDDPVVNTDPTAADGTDTTAEDTVGYVIDIADLIADAEDGQPEITAASSGDGTVTIDGTTLVFTPTADFNGDAVIAYTVTDTDGATASAEVTVTVTPVNDAPTLGGALVTPPAPITSGETGFVDLDGLLPADVDGTVPTLEIGNPGDLPAGIVLLAEGISVAADTAAGIYDIEIVASDGALASAPITVQVTVEDAVVVPFETVYLQAEDGVPGAGNSAATVVRDAGNPETGGFTGLRPDFSGTGYIDFGSAAGDAFTYTFDDSEGGSRVLHVRYASNGARPLDVQVNAASVLPGGATPFADTDPDGPGIDNPIQGFDNWEIVTFDITTVQGENTVTLEIPAPGANAPNVDAIAITKPGEAVSFFVPQITSDAAFTVDENTTEIGQVVAEDIDGNGVTFALSGVDSDKVSIDGNGALTLNDPADFEIPTDDGADGIYNVTVAVTGDGETVTQDLTITVADVEPELATPTIDPIVVQSEALVITGTTTVHSTQTDSAEDVGATGKDAYNLNPGYSGFGYTDYGSAPGDAVSWTVNVEAAGLYDLTIRYASGGTRPLDLTVGAGAPQTVAFAQEGPTAFATWTTLVVPVELAAGDNTIALAIPAGRTNGPNIDALALTTVGAAAVFPPVNVQPVFDTVDLAIEVNEGETGVIGTFAATDPESDPLTYTLAGPDEALFTIDDQGAVSFIAAPDFGTPGDVGGDNQYDITILADDGKAPVIEQQVTVTVAEVPDTPPTAENGTGAGLEDATAIVVDIANLVDDAEDAGEPTLVAATVDPAQGTVTFVGTELTFTPAADFNGDAVIAYTVEDSAGQPASASVTVTVAAVNDAPVLAAATDATVPATGGTVALADLGLIATDVDSDPITLSIVGDLPAGVTFDGTSLIVSDTAAPGTTTITVVANDGTVDSDSVSFDLTVQEPVDVPASAITLTALATPENVAGAIVADVVVTDPDTTYMATELALIGADAALFELVDGPDGLQLKLVDGASLDFEAAQPSVTVTLGALASAPFTPTVTDVAEPVAITFNGPIGSYNFNQDRPQNGGSGVTVSDDNTAVTLDGNLWKRVALDADYVITENSRLQVTMEIGANVPEIVAIGFDNNNNPFQNDQTVYQIGGTQDQPNFVDLRGTGTDNEDGTFTFIIDLSAQAGITRDSLVLVADDDVGGGANMGSVTFSAASFFENSGNTGGNTPPREVGGGVADFAIPEGGTIEVDLPFVDDDGDALTFGFSITDAGGVEVIVPGLELTDGVLSGPIPADPGLYTITLTADDDGDGPNTPVTSTFQLTVIDVNDAPISTDPALEPYFFPAGTPIPGIDLVSFEGFFSDPDGDTLTLTAENLPAGLIVNEEGVIEGTPTAGGDFTVTIRATDPSGLSATLTIDLQIEGGQIGDAITVEAEDFTGLAGATGFFATGQAGASDNQIIRVAGGNVTASVSTELSQNGVVEGWYQVSMTRYDETEDSAQYSLQIGDTVLADQAAFDGIPDVETANDTFDNGNPRGNAGQSGNLKTIVFDTPVFISAGTVLTLSGVSNGEVLRTDKFTFTRVAEPNEAPGETTLSASTVVENVTDGAAIGDLSAIDPDGDDAAIIFSVDDVASPFEVVGTTLQLKAGQSFDFETTPSVDVTVTATDADGASTDTVLTVTVTDVNEPVSAPVLTAGTVEENADGAIIGTLASVDPEDGTITFTVDAASPFEVVNGNELKLKDGETLDFEATPSVTVSVTADDGTGPVAADVSFDVTDVNEAPTLAVDAALADLDVPNGAGAAIDLSVLGATDEDAGDTPAYMIGSATETPLPAGFLIDTDGVTLLVPTDAPAGAYEIEVFATDGELDSESVVFTVTVGAPAPFEPFVIQAEDTALVALVVLDDGANTTVTTIRDADNPESNPSLVNGLRPDFSGTGYLDFGDFAGDAIVFTVNVPVAGDYDLNVRYASQGVARPLDLSVNSGAASSLAFLTTDPDGTGPIEGFDNWEFLTQTVALTAGDNSISLAIPAGASTGPNIDRIEITEAGTGPIPPADLSADEDGNLAAAPENATVAIADLATVEIRLTGVDADIIGYEVSLDDGVTFAPITPVADGADQVLTVDLTGTAAGSTVDVQVRLTDDAANTVTTTASVAVQGDTVAPFELVIQLENRDGSITIDDDTPGTGEGDPLATQFRDLANIEGVQPGRTDGLWDGYSGTGYMDMGGNIGDAFEFDVDAPTAGTYSFTFRYVNAGGDGLDRPLLLSVNGTETATVPFPITGTGNTGWTNWTDVTVEIALAAGPNTIRMENTIANGPNIDRVTISREGDVVDPGVEPGPRDTIKINFQDGAAPKVDGYLVDNFEGFADRGNGQSYGWVTEASVTDGDETDAVAIDGSAYPEIAINERTGGVFDTYDARLTGYAHFDLGSYPGAQDDPNFRTAWQIALENGFYEVTVSVGDTGGLNDSNNRLFIEGALKTAWAATDTFKSQLVTATVEVSDGVLTLSAPGGNITEMQYLEIRNLPDLTPGDGNDAPADYASFADPRAISGVGATSQSIELTPGDGVRPEGIDPSAGIVLGINVVDGRGGIGLESLSDGSIKLFETLTGIEVPYSANTTAGFDSVTISPIGGLKENTSYTLLVDGARDQGPGVGDAPREFQKFSTSFVTGEAAEVVDRAVAFVDTVELNGAADGAFAFTSIEISPDKTQLYVTTIGGQIKRWDLNPDGSIDKASEETFSPGGDFTAEGRGFIGIVFDPEDPGTIWVTDNAEIPLNGRDNGVPDFSGSVSKVELGTGGSLENASMSTYITGLPRSNGDHVTNSLEFRANPDAGVDGAPDFLMYLIQGSNSAMGDADSAWGFRPERLLNAAVMEIDHTRDAPPGGFDVSTEPLPDDGQNRRFPDPDGDLKNGGILISNAQDAALNGKFLHFAENGVATVRDGADAGSALFREYYDPFAEDAVLSIFSTGQRNAYDLVWHSNGFLYVPTNGSAGGGISPDNPDTPINEQTSHPTQDDYLFRVVEGGYYGHPNPVRDEFILNGGNPTGGADPNQANGYGVGINPDPNYDLEGSYSLGTNRSPNGATEYTSDVFGNSLQNALLFVQYSNGNNVRVVLLGEDGTPTQDFILQRPDGSDINNYADPLDIIEGANGQLYVMTLNRGNGQSQIIRLEPAPGGVVGDNTADEGNDLALLVIDGTDPASVLFEVTGLDADIQTLSVSFDGGTTQTPVTLDAQNRFTADLNAETGPVTATLTVNDDDGNTASDGVTFTPGETPEPQGLYDGRDFVNLDPGSTVIRLLEDPSTHETAGNANDTDSDGLNDGYDGTSYVDFGGGAGDKVSLGVTVAVAGVYDVVLRLANGNATQARPIDVKLGDQVVSIANTQTGADFTTWTDFPIQLTLEAGLNTLVFEQMAANGGPNIDSVTVTLDTPLGVPNDGLETVNGVTFVKYEAENAALAGDPEVVTTADDDRGQSGGAFVDAIDPGDDTVTWTISVAEAGVYQVDILYALGTSGGVAKAPRPMDLTVNGTVAQTLPFVSNSNAGETIWGPQSATLTLAAGVNTLSVTAPGGVGPNLDYLRVSQSPLTDPQDLTADEGGDLTLSVVDQTDASAVVLEISGLDDDIETAQISFNGGAAITVTPQNGQVTVDTGIAFGTIDAVLTVTDDANNTATAEADFAVAPDGNVNADIEIQSLDPAFFDNRLHFSFIQNPQNGDLPDREFKENAFVRITNSGTEALEIFSLQIDGPFELPEPTFDSFVDGLTLDPGASLDVEVLFDADAINPKPGSGQNGVQEGALTLVTNDAEDPIVTVDLAGFWQSQDEAGQEPNVNEVWQVFGFGNVIPGLSFVGGGENSVLNFDDYYIPAPGAESFEVLSPYWRIADGVTQVTATQIAAFHGPGGASLGIHAPGNKNADVGLSSHAGDNNQSILPLQGNGSFATSTFTNATIPDAWAGNDVFGIEMVNLSTDPTLNISGGGTPSQALLDSAYGPGTYFINGDTLTDADGNVISDGYTVRMFQALDAEGDAIENVFLGVMDYTGINYDYNDNMFIFEGITPVGNGGTLSIAGLDAAAADDRLVFTNIDNPNNSGGIGGQVFRNTAEITLTNDGIGILDITGFTLGGVNAADFQVTGTLGTLVSGASTTVTIEFVGSDSADDGAAELKNATLTVESDGFEGDQVIQLAGLAQFQSEGGEEPTVAQIVEAFGYSTNVAQGQLNNGGTVEIVGDEVLLPYLQRLDGSQPIEVIQIAAFLQATNVARLNIHDLESSATTELFAQDDQQAQTVSPEGLVSGSGSTGSVAAVSIDRDDPFGLYIAVDGLPTFVSWSDPEANRLDPTIGSVNGGVVDPDEGHLIRYFEAKDADGNVIEGTYIAIQDYPGAGNYDYNDHMFVIKNVQGYDLTAADDADSDGISDALQQDDDNDGTVNFFDDDFTPPPGPQSAFNATQTPWAVDGDGLTLMANLFDTGGQDVAYNDTTVASLGDTTVRPGEAVDISTGTGAIGFTAEGEWVEYTINVAQDGEYELSFNSSSPISGRLLTATFAAGGVVYETATASVPNTGAYTTYEDTAAITVDLQAGVQVLRVNFDNNQQDLMSFTLTPEAVEPSGQTPFPGPNAPVLSELLTVEAENFDNGGQGVSWNDNPGRDGTSALRADTDVELVGAQNDIGFILAGEWVEYTINVAEAGNFELSLNAKTPIAGNSIAVSLEDAAAFATFALVDANGAGDNGFGGTVFSQTPAQIVSLEAGVQTLRFTFDGAPAINGYVLDFRSFTLDRTETVTPNTPPTTTTVTGVPEGEANASYNFDVSGFFDDLEDDDLEFGADGLPTGLSISADGVITGTPAAAGDFTVTVTATDDDGASVDDSFTLIVADEVIPNAAPTTTGLADDGATEGTAYTFATAGAFDDPDGDMLSYSASGLPTGLAINAVTGLISGTLPDVGADTDFAITVTASDQEFEVSTTFTLSVDDIPVVGPTIIGEAGKVTFEQTDATTWFSVSFTQSLENPSVVMGPLSFNGPEAATMRVRNVDNDGFEFQLDEWDYLDGGHLLETVGWMAVEQGVHQLGNGQVIAAGVGSANGAGVTSINFGHDFGTNGVAVVGQVSTTNQSQAVVERIHNVDADSFDVVLSREEAATQAHGNEDFSWIAASLGVSEADGFQAGVTPNAVEGKARFTFSFEEAFATSDEFAFLGDLQTINGEDTALLRLALPVSNTGVSVFAEEEQSDDRETGHVNEVASYFAVEVGTIFGTDGIA